MVSCKTSCIYDKSSVVLPKKDSFTGFLWFAIKLVVPNGETRYGDKIDSSYYLPSTER